MTSKKARTETGADDIEAILNGSAIDSDKQVKYVVPTEMLDAAQAYIQTLLETHSKEHYLGAGEGTQTKCSCGKTFMFAAEANQHIEWQLRTQKLVAEEFNKTLDLVEAEVGEKMHKIFPNNVDGEYDDGWNDYRAHTLEVIERLRTSSRPSGSAVRKEVKQDNGGSQHGL